MKFYYLLVLFNVCSIFCNNVDEADEEKKRLIDQLTKTKPVILKDYQLVVRHVGIDVYMFRSYRTVSALFYPIGDDVKDARFTFQSEELHLNKIGSCSPREVVLQLKHGSFPAVNPDGYPFPKDFVDPIRRSGVHTLELMSDGTNTTYGIQNPKPGMWYALVYIKWEDPRTQKVEQEGLVADCVTILYTDLQIKKDRTSKYISCYDDLIIDYNTIPMTYKCKSKDSIEPITLNVIIVNAAGNNKISIQIESANLPTDNEFMVNCAFDPNINNVQKITFNTYPTGAHYIHVDYIEYNRTNVTDVADCESYAELDINYVENQTLINLMRDEKDRFFTFDYGLPTTDLQDASSLVNLTSNEIKTLRFDINQFVDVGGNLIIEASLLMSFKYYMGYKREIVNESLQAFTEDNQFIKVVICINIGHPSIPLHNGFCKFNDEITPAYFVINSTDSDSIYDKVVIPYPESGTWYMSFRMFCDNIVCPCRTSDNGTKYYVNNTTDKQNSDITTGDDALREGVTECNATIVLSISSASCISGRCSNRGNCVQNSFGGLVLSYCMCSAGYGGWDCSDDSRIDSSSSMLISVLLLTLSNLLFIFSVYVAVIRMYYPEAMIYCFTMIFSTFYHACDAPVQISYCIIRGHILQFGDFYCGLMSFWMTLIAMSTVPAKHCLQLTGAIVIALLTTWNMHSVVSFLLPVAAGGLTLVLSWYVYYRIHKRWRYPRSYYSTYLPIGLILVTVGLVCYAFLQTEQNYKVVHSVWHMIIALSVAFLLPDAKRRDANPFVPRREYYKNPFRGVFNVSRNGNASSRVPGAAPSDRRSNVN